MKTQIKKIIIVALSAAILSSCNSGQSTNSAMQNFKQTEEYKMLTSTDSSYINVDLSSSPLLNTMQSYNVYVYDNLKAKFVGDSYPFTCKSRANCAISIPTSILEKKSGNTSLYLLVVDDTGMIRGATDEIAAITKDGFPNYNIASVNVYSTAKFFDIALQNNKQMDSGSYYKWRNEIVNKYSLDTIKNKFPAEIKPYVNFETLTYFYMLNNLPKDLNNNVVNKINDILKNFNEDAFKKFAESPKLTGDELTAALTKLNQAAADKSLAETAKWMAENSSYFNTAGDLAGKIPGAGGVLKGAIQALPNIFDSVAGMTNSKAALDTYNQIQARYENIIAPTMSTLDYLAKITSQLDAVNDTLIDIYTAEDIELLKTSYNLEQVSLLNNDPDVGGFENADGTIQTYMAQESIKNASTFDGLAALVYMLDNSGSGTYSKNDMNQFKTVINTFSNETAKTRYKTLRSKLKLDEKINQNNIAVSRYYNYLVTKISLDYVALNNKFMEIELSAAYAKFAKYTTTADSNSVNKFRNSITIPDIAKASNYDDAVYNIKSEANKRNSEILKVADSERVDVNAYVPPIARHLLENNVCDFDYADQTTLKGTCKYFVPTSVSKSGYKLNYSSMDGNSCDKSDNDFMKISGVFNRAGNIECLNYKDTDHDSNVYQQSIINYNIDSKNAWYWDNNSFFYPNMRTGDSQQVSYEGYTEGIRFISLANPNGTDFKFARIDSNGNFINHSGKIVAEQSDIKWSNTNHYYNIGTGSTYIRAEFTALGLFDNYNNLIGLFKPNIYHRSLNTSTGNAPQQDLSVDMRPLLSGCSAEKFSGKASCKGLNNNNYDLSYTSIFRNDQKNANKGGYNDFLFGYTHWPYNDKENARIQEFYRNGGSYGSSCATNKDNIATNGYYIAARSCGGSDGRRKNSVFGNGNQLIKDCSNNDGIIKCNYM